MHETPKLAFRNPEALQEGNLKYGLGFRVQGLGFLNRCETPQPHTPGLHPKRLNPEP